MAGYEGINDGVRGYYWRGTRVLMAGYEGINAMTWGVMAKYEDISLGL